MDSGWINYTMATHTHSGEQTGITDIDLPQ